MTATENAADVWLSPAEAAVRAGRSESTILKWLRGTPPRLPSIRDRVNGSRLRIRLSDLEKLLGTAPAASE